MKILNNLILPGKHKRPIIADVFYKETNKQKPIVIFCHGYKSFKDWGTFNLMAKEFAQASFVFIKFNFSHNGGTSEQPIDFPDLEAFSENNYSIELDDLESTIDWAISTNEIPNLEANRNKIFLLGHSRGGGIAILKSSENKKVKKLATLSSVGSYGQRFLSGSHLKEWKENGIFFVENSRTKQKMPHKYQFYEDFIKNKDRLDIPSAEKKLTIPHLIVHGTEDETVSFKEARKLHQLNNNSILIPIENTGHTYDGKHPYMEKHLPEPLKKAVEKIIRFFKAEN